MRASVIIPVWNGRRHLPDCLTALSAEAQASGAAVEIIAVDNASDDDSAEFIATSFPDVRLIRSAYNRGFSGGCNLGLGAARGKDLFLLNQDVVVRSGWLPAMLTAFAEHPGAGVVGGKGLYPDGRIQHAGGRLDWPLGLALHLGYRETDDGQWDSLCEVDYVTGAAIGIRRAVVERAGLLDEGFWPGYYEDADFCMRARDAGFQVLYSPAAVYVHSESASTAAASRAWYTQRGRLRLVLKHLPLDRWLGEFVAAELAAQPDAMHRGQSRALRWAYLETALDAPSILRARGLDDPVPLRRVQAALHELCRRAWRSDWQIVLAKLTDEFGGSEQRRLAGDAPAADRPSSKGPKASAERRPAGAGETDPMAEDETWLELSEYQFQSSVPVVGPIIARLRSWWLNVAARWALLHVIQQQQTVNRRLYRQMHVLAERVRELAEEDWLVASRLAANSQRAPDQDE